MENEELRALVSLLDEPNESNYSSIQERIFSYGTDVIPILEEVWDNSFNELIQYRIENIIHKLSFRKIKEDLINWKINEQENLLKGYIIISKYQYPDLKETIINESINLIKKDLWLEINPNLTALEQIKVLNHIFFEIHKFSANRENPQSYNYLFVNNLIENKKGTTVSMGIIYLILAQSVHLPIFGVDLHQNFILAYTKSITHKTEKQDVLFYINPFNKGIVFSSNEIDLYLKQMNLEVMPEYYKPCSNISIIKLILKTMKSFYLKETKLDKVDEINELVEILNNIYII